MNRTFAAIGAGLILLSATLRAQDAKIVADNLEYSREFYSGVHFVAIATSPRSFAYDRYPDNGPERVRCDDGTFARKHGQPWLKSNDWGETGQTADKETARKLDGWIKLVDAAFHSMPPKVKLSDKSEADGRMAWIFEARSQNAKGLPTRLRFAKPLYDKNESVLLHGFDGSMRLEGDKVVPASAVNPVKLSFGYLVNVQGGYELSERAWEDLEAPKPTASPSAPAEPKIGPNPQTAEGYATRANARGRNGDLNGAIADFTHAIELDPTLASAYYDRGFAKREKGNFDGAIADFSHAIELKPNDREFYNDRGIAKRAKGDNDGAIADYTRAIEIDPKAAEFSYYNRAVARNAKNDLDGALADYNRAIELNPKNANAFNNRGNVKKAKGELDGAIADFNSAIELNPKLAIAYKNRGEAERAKGDSTGADVDFNRAAELNPELKTPEKPASP